MFGFEPPVMPVIATLVAMACPSPSAPEMHVSQSVDRPEYEFTLSSSELAQFDIDTIPPYAPQEELRVGGLTSTEITVVADVTFQTATDTTDDTVCIWPKLINVKLKMRPKVYVASEHPSGSCRHAAVVKHEKKHVAEDERLGRELLPALRRAVERAVAQKPVGGPAPVAQMDLLEKRMVATIDREVEALLQEFYKRRSIHQRAIDNLDEYERIQASCPGKWYE